MNLRTANTRHRRRLRRCRELRPHPFRWYGTVVGRWSGRMSYFGSEGFGKTHRVPPIIEGNLIHVDFGEIERRVMSFMGIDLARPGENKTVMVISHREPDGKIVVDKVEEL